MGSDSFKNFNKPFLFKNIKISELPSNIGSFYMNIHIYLCVYKHAFKVIYALFDNTYNYVYNYMYIQYKRRKEWQERHHL